MVARVQKFGLLRGFFSILVGVLGLAAVWAFGIRTLVFQPFSTPSSAMAPTLQIGDYFFASKWVYGYSRYSLPFAPAGSKEVFAHEPRRGDVVVLRNPKDGTEYVKRIIGLPGDEIQLKRARLFINGNLVERRAVKGASPMRDPMGEPIVAPTYDEYLPSGAVHRIVQIEGDDGEWSNTNVFVTPPGAYFVLGDNRDNSVDSANGFAGPWFRCFREPRRTRRVDLLFRRTGARYGPPETAHRPRRPRRTVTPRERDPLGSNRHCEFRTGLRPVRLG